MMTIRLYQLSSCFIAMFDTCSIVASYIKVYFRYITSFIKVVCGYFYLHSVIIYEKEHRDGFASKL